MAAAGILRRRLVKQTISGRGLIVTMSTPYSVRSTTYGVHYPVIAKTSPTAVVAGDNSQQGGKRRHQLHTRSPHVRSSPVIAIYIGHTWHNTNKITRCVGVSFRVLWVDLRSLYARGPTTYRAIISAAQHLNHVRMPGVCICPRADHCTNRS